MDRTSIRDSYDAASQRWVVQARRIRLRTVMMVSARSGRRQPRVDSRDGSAWRIVRSYRGGTVELLLDVGPRPLVARLTRAELAAVEGLLHDVAKADRSGEYSRIKLGSAFRAAIGRDPFRQAGRDGSAQSRGLVPVWLDLVYVVIGLGFAASHTNPWLRLAGFAFAAVAVGDLIGHAVRRLRRRSG